MDLDQLLEQATEHHRAGRLPEARGLYEQLLAAKPAHPLALFRVGLLELQEGRPAAALPLIERAIDAAPQESRYQSGRGQVLVALERWGEAADAYRRVIALDAGAADGYLALGAALQAGGDYAGAIDAYEGALRIDPQLADALMNVGYCQQRAGRPRAAEAAYRRVLALRPDYPGARSNLGAILMDLGQTEAALALLREAADQEPDAVQPAVNLGAALCRQRAFAEAAARLAAARRRDPANADAAFNLGIALQGLGQLREAATAYRDAATLRPGHVDALINLGNTCNELGEFEHALAAYDAAIAANSGSVVALNNAGCLLRSRGRLDEAETLFRRGLALDPRHAPLLNNLGNALKDAGELDASIDCFRAALALDPDYLEAHSNLAYSLTFQALDGQVALAECRRFNDRFARPLAADIRPHDNDRSADRRLRIGYVSPDFRDHCQSLFTIPTLRHHDHGAFEVFCYSSVQRPDRYTRRLAGYADVWREVRLLDDAALAARIRDDRIDVLVDLTMHMSYGRPLLFARKPAPVQVAWLAYPGTTGIAAIDYRLSDPRLDPEGYDSQYSERTIRLPDTFWCYDPLTDTPAVSALPALATGSLTFGCLNNPCKLTDATLRLWGRVLGECADATLLLLAPPGRHRARLLERLAAQGVAAARVRFVPFRPRAEYLATYHQIDVGLDTFPYNGHTTSIDSFWMGVPVVTRVGATCVGRAGLSQLVNLGLPELAADSDAGFAAAAVALAADRGALARLRGELRGRLERSPLMAAERFTRGLEAAYRRAWRDYVGAAAA